MYIVIDGKTHKLKEFNSERRQVFVANVLSNYGSSSIDDYARKIKDEVKRLYDVEISLEKAKKDFFKEFDSLIYKTVWEFLKDDDKKQLGTLDKLNLHEDEKIKFIEFYSDKVRQLTDLGSETGEKVDPLTVQTFVAKSLGRSIEEVSEMDEMLLINLIQEIVNLVKQERVDTVNLNALAHAYASGNKSAKSQVKELSNEAKRSQNYKKLKDLNPEQIKESTSYSAADLKRLANGR